MERQMIREQWWTLTSVSRQGMSSSSGLDRSRNRGGPQTIPSDDRDTRVELVETCSEGRQAGWSGIRWKVSQGRLLVAQPNLLGEPYITS